MATLVKLRPTAIRLRFGFSNGLSPVGSREKNRKPMIRSSASRQP